MIEEINGCPHEEGVDYPVGEVCPKCLFWADRQRPIEPQPPPAFLMAVATYREDQWDKLRASVADGDSMDETWEKWNEGIEEVIANLELQGPPLCLRSAGRGRNRRILPGKRRSQPFESTFCFSHPESTTERKRIGMSATGSGAVQRFSVQR
jgi:hypothetical protein